jgi:predicted dehydrogenase
MRHASSIGGFEGSGMKVAVMGCGRIGATHAAAVRELGGGTSLVFSDPDLRAARRTAASFGGGAAYRDVDECLAAERPDVVHVCTPPDTHAELAVRALSAGAAVLVEKPLALSRTETALVADALCGRPGALCVDHNFLFEPCMLRARGWVSAGRIGRVLAADIFYGVEPLPGGTRPAPWVARLPGGRFADVLPHALYLARHFMGDVEQVAACDARGPAGCTELGVTLACARGLAAVRVSLAATPWELGIVLRGDEGTIRVDLARQRAVLLQVPRGAGRRTTQLRVAAATAAQTALGVVDRALGKATGRLRGYPGMRALIAAFHRSVRDGLPPPVPFHEGAAAVSAMEAILASLGAVDTASAPSVPA